MNAKEEQFLNLFFVSEIYGEFIVKWEIVQMTERTPKSPCNASSFITTSVVDIVVCSVGSKVRL
jgi:hypothetical protein